jgi:hypothetical protein
MLWTQFMVSSKARSRRTVRPWPHHKRAEQESSPNRVALPLEASLRISHTIFMMSPDATNVQNKQVSRNDAKVGLSLVMWTGSLPKQSKQFTMPHSPLYYFRCSTD